SSDLNFQAWPQRKNDTRVGGAILVATGNLRDSTQIKKATIERIEISNDAPYAEIHNSGGIVRLPVTDKMRKYFWYMFKATGQVRWKYMAITKKERMIFRMPKRQFIGDSRILNANIDRAILNRILTEFKNYK